MFGEGLREEDRKRFPKDALTVYMPSNGNFKFAGQVLSWPDGHIPTVRRIIRDYDQRTPPGLSYQGTQFVSTGDSAFSVRPLVSQTYSLPASGYPSSYMPVMSYRPVTTYVNSRGYSMMAGYSSGSSRSGYSSGGSRRLSSFVGRRMTARPGGSCGPGG